MVQRGRRVFLQILAELGHAGLGGGRVGVAFRRDAHANRGERRAELVVVFHRRPVALEPRPAAVLALHGPHLVEGLPRERVQLAGGGRVVEGQHGGRGDNFRVPARPLVGPALAHQLFGIAADLAWAGASAEIAGRAIRKA